MLLEFAAKAVTQSSGLHTLHTWLTFSSAEDGDKFLQALADGTINSLQHLSIDDAKAWFADNRDGSMAPLLVLLARQTSLESLMMEYNNLSEAKKQQIREVVTSIAAKCQIQF